MTPVEETVAVLDDLVRAGKLRYIGVSNFAGWQLMKSLAAADRALLSPLLSVPESVTKTMTDFSIDPSHLEAHRVKLARAIEKLSRR